MLSDPDKQATVNCEPANEMNKEDPTQGIPEWLQPFTVNREDLETHVLAHACEREISDSEGDASKADSEGDASKVRTKMEAQYSNFRKDQKRSIP